MKRAVVIFVFGSNLRGIHGAGAARDAVRHYGAIMGRASGRQGRSYAIPTCDNPGSPLPLDEIADWVALFLGEAEQTPNLTYLVTRIGCGLAGYPDATIAPLFETAPPNCCLPIEWTAIYATHTETPA